MRLKNHIGIGIVQVVAILLLASPTSAQTIIHVDDHAPGDGDGAGWDTAFTYLQDALAAAAAGDEIRVAGGIYRPDRDEAGNVAPRSREASFQLIDGVSIYGGYAGYGQPDPDARDITAYRTILSGDLIGDDGPDFANNGENSNHVVTGRNIGPGTVISGLTITGGNADTTGAASGGGMNNEFRSSPTVIDCTFYGNSAYSSGGGMECYASEALLINCAFNGNRTTASIPTLGFGGGLRNTRSDTLLVNCAFNGNSANAGGAVLNSIDCDVRLINCTFAANAADHGRALACDSPHHPGTVNMSNCILWDGGDEVFNGDGSTITISYSDVQGGWPGEGNLDFDPRFADAGGADGVPGTADDDLRLQSGSRCIDAGSNGAVPPDTADLDADGDTSERTPLDLAGGARFVDDRQTDTGAPDPPDYRAVVDMGAYEFLRDCNTNGVADQQDIAAGSSQDCNGNGIPDECEADSDGDGLIDACDACPDSDLSDTIVIDGCDTQVPNMTPADDGCTMADAIAECAAGATTHQAFVSCVVQLADQWRQAGLISGAERARIRRCAIQADIPPGPRSALSTD